MSSYDYYPIQGIKVEPGEELPLRLEIDDWWNSEKLEHQWQKSLFVRALQILQDTDPTKRLSYFQIAGIHGMPYKEWDQPDPKDHGMYCAHSTVLFPTWHRPYLLLLEQRLHEIMVRDVIKGQFKNHVDLHDELEQAADIWRLPYWDWAALKGDDEVKALDVPTALKEDRVEILRTRDTVESVPNPLWKFRMPKGKPMKDYGVIPIEYENEAPKPPDIFYFQECVATTKYPETAVFNPEEKQDKTVKHDVQRWYQISKHLRDPTTKIVKNRKTNEADTLRDTVYRLFTYDGLKDFRTFATSRYHAEQRAEDYISLEHVHNNLHNWIGGGGHMSHVPVSSFDPIFWLHHNNIDRLFAIWQALNENSWFEPLKENPEEPDNINGPETDLIPFHPVQPSKSSELFYNSNMCRYTTKLGYAYPETKPGLTRKETLAMVEKLYASLQTFVQQPPPEISEVSLKQDDFTGLRDYVVNVNYERFALSGTPFTVHIFVGEVPLTLPYNYAPGSTQVGNVYNFVAPPTNTIRQGCENCAQQQAAGVKVCGQVVLTNALIERVRNGTYHEYSSTPGDDFHYLRSMKASDVLPFLKANLHWRVTKITGNLVDRESLPGLKVSVAVGRADFFPEDASKPVKYYGYEVAYDVTDTRESIGGVAPGDGTYA